MFSKRPFFILNSWFKPLSFTTMIVDRFLCPLPYALLLPLIFIDIVSLYYWHFIFAFILYGTQKTYVSSMSKYVSSYLHPDYDRKNSLASSSTENWNCFSWCGLINCWQHWTDIAISVVKTSSVLVKKITLWDIFFLLVQHKVSSRQMFF